MAVLAGCSSLPTLEFCLVYQDTKVCVEFDPASKKFRLSGDIDELSKLSEDILNKIKNSIKERFGVDVK